MSEPSHRKSSVRDSDTPSHEELVAELNMKIERLLQRHRAKVKSLTLLVDKMKVHMTTLSLFLQRKIDLLVHVDPIREYEHLALLMEFAWNVLDYDDVGKLRPNYENVDVYALITQCVQDCMYYASHSSLRVNCEIEHGVHGKVLLDPVIARESLREVLGNAIKFSTGNEVSVNVGLVRRQDLPEYSDGDYNFTLVLRIQISNEGKFNIARDKLFQPFSSSSGVPGRGLGLYRTDKRLRLMSSFVRVQQISGLVTATMLLPFDTTPATEDTFNTGITCVRRERVKSLVSNDLIVDGNSEVILYGAAAGVADTTTTPMVLSALGFKVDVAVQPEEFYRMLQKRRYCIALASFEVLMQDDGDVQLPLHFREWEKTRKLPPAVICAITTELQAGELDKTDLLTNGVVQYTVMEGQIDQIVSVLGQEFSTVQEGEVSVFPSVLIVDDDVGTVKLLCRCCQDAGYDVQYAFNGVQALAKMREKTFDYVFMDQGLPIAKGDETVQMFRSWENMYRTQKARQFVFAVTGTQQPLPMGKGGFDGVIQKPFTPAMLQQMMQSVAEGKK